MKMYEAKELADELLSQGSLVVKFTCTKAQQDTLGLGKYRTLRISAHKLVEGLYKVQCTEGQEEYPSENMNFTEICRMISRYKAYEICDNTSTEDVIELSKSDLKSENQLDTTTKSSENLYEIIDEHTGEQVGLVGSTEKQSNNAESSNEQLSNTAKTQDSLTERIKQTILSHPKQEQKRIKHGKGCELCNYTGWITDKETGLTVQCNCQVANQIKQQVQVTKAPQVKIKNYDALRAVVPLEYRNKDFDIDKAKVCAGSIAMSLNSKIVGYNNYIETLSSILTAITTSELKNSYIIGAPNGFGKATFVYTAIKRLIAQGKPVVPYLPLVELAEIRVEYESRLLSKLRNPRFSKSLREDPNEYIWKDFIDVPVLFTCFSSVDSKTIESATLSTLMNLRSAKGRPTVVMIPFSLEPYTNDSKLRQYYWNDMISLNNKENSSGVDRLIHRSCYLREANSMNVIKGVDY